jgi:hypothetical protein
MTKKDRLSPLFDQMEEYEKEILTSLQDLAAKLIFIEVRLEKLTRRVEKLEKEK